MSKSQDIQKLEHIFNKWKDGLHYFAVQYVKEEDLAMEIVNDAFMAIWDRRGDLPLDETIKSYLYTTVRNKCLNAIKKKNPERYAEDVSAINKGSQYTEQHNLEAQETERKINKAIDTLPNKCREIFLLSRIEGLSYKQISEVMEVTPKTVENQIGIALKVLKKKLL